MKNYQLYIKLWDNYMMMNLPLMHNAKFHMWYLEMRLEN